MSSKKQKPFYPPPVLPRTGVEAHAHLGGKAFKDDFEEVLARAAAAGVERICQVFLSPEAYEAGKVCFDAHPEVFFCLGIHPIDAHQFTDASIEANAAIMARDPRVKAVGEIGLDYYWKECPPEVQKHFFIRQLRQAKELNLPVVLHCRDAVEDCFSILKAEGMHGYPLLWHCFGGDTAMAVRIIDNDWHLSIPGPITYPANQPLRDAVAAVPLDRLLTETDCPYLSPEPLRGKRNEPANLGYTVAAMAKARNMDPAELWTICGNNAKRFFRLEEGGE